MKNLRTIILSAMVAGVLIVPGTSARADAKDGKEYSHFRKTDQHGKWKGDHGRRDGYHERGRDQHGRYDKHNYRRDVRHDNRGHHNKPEIRQDFKDIRNGASKEEIFRDRQEIRADVKEIGNDRRELRQDQNTLQSARRELKADLRKR